MEEQISGMQCVDDPVYIHFLVPRWSDPEHGESLPTEGYVAVLLGFPFSMASQIPDWMDQRGNSVRIGVHAVPEKQACC